MAQPITAQVDVPGIEGEGANFPPFDVNTFGSQLLWLAITFAVLYLLMSRVIVPRLSGILEDRRERIAGDLRIAAESKARAEEAGEAYEKALAEARGRAHALAQETRDRLAAEVAEKRAALEAELARNLADAEARITASKEKAMGNVEAIASDAAAAIVERLTGQAPAADVVAAAVGKAMAQ